MGRGENQEVINVENRERIAIGEEKEYDRKRIGNGSKRIAKRIAKDRITMGLQKDRKRIEKG